MEQWEHIMDNYKGPPNLRTHGKMLQVATKLIKQDLAVFEVEWLTDSLLRQPVNILSVICNKQNDESWYKNVGDSFKLLSELIDGYGDVVKKYFEDIVKTCLPYHQYDSITRQHALACLTSICKLSEIGARNMSQHVEYIMNNSTSRSPVAVLIGTICDYHPEVIADDINTIWRTYLITLDDNKNTDKVQSSILRGIAGILKHFGCDLPMVEINSFYDKLVQCLRLNKCKDVCIELLGCHTDIFLVGLSKDATVRSCLRTECHQDRKYTGHLYRIYCAVCTKLKRDGLMNLIQSEILPLLNSDRSHVKYLAHRILWHIQHKYNVCLADVVDADVHTLEFELHSGVVSYDVAEEILWCIESKVPESDKLLQSSVLLYENLPAARVKEIVVHGILKAEDRVRNDTVIYLTQQTVQELDKYTKLWSLIFDTDKNKDIIVLEKSKFVFEDFLSYTTLVLDGYLEEECEVMPDKIKCLLKLYRLVASLYRAVEMNDFESDHPLLTRNKSICIELCRDEEELCESCLDIIETDFCQNIDDILMSLKVVFSRNDVEPRVLILSLKKLENIITNSKEHIDQYILSDIIRSIENLRTRKDLTCKDGRVLQKDVLMFLGKFANLSDLRNVSKEDDVLLIKLQELTLNVPNPLDGATYKLNLQKVLHEALIYENTAVLTKLLAILCSNLSQRKELIQQQILTLVIKSLTNVYCHSNDSTENDAILKAVHAAVTFCDSIECVGMFVNYISEEISPGVRKMLSVLLEMILTKDSDAILNETIINTVAEHVVLMDCPNSTKKRAGLNITEIVMRSSKDNNQLSVKLLPNIITTVAKTLEVDADVTLNIATEMFIEKIELFDEQTVTKLIKDLIRILLKNHEEFQENITLKFYKKTVKLTIGFFNDIFNNLKFEKVKIFDDLFEVFNDKNDDLAVLLYLITEIKVTFALNSELCKEIIFFKYSYILKQLFCMDIVMAGNFMCMEMILIFIEEFAQSLLALHYQETKTLLSKVIQKLTPKSVKMLQKRIKSCFTKYFNIFDSIPVELIAGYDSWCCEIPVKEITVCLEKELFKPDHALAINSLKIMMDTFKVTETSNFTAQTAILTDVKKYSKIWIRYLLQWFSKGYMKRNLKSELPYLTDVLTVAVKCQSFSDLKLTMLEGHGLEGVSNENVGIEFIRFFMVVYFDRFLSKPFVLVDCDMVPCVLLLSDVTLYAITKKLNDESYDCILELVCELWPTYLNKSTFDQKCNLLSNLNSFPQKLSFQSEPIQWACSIVTTESSREEKAKIIAVLPGGKEYAQTYRSFASILPLKPSEWRRGASAVLTALTFDDEMLDIVAAQAQGLSDSEDWWLSSVEKTMSDMCARAQAPRDNACDIIYRRCWEGMSGTVCRRMLVPILRFSSIQFCEKFLSTKIKELLGTLARVIKTPTGHSSYKQMIANYTRVFYILQIAFEKLPDHVLQSPHSLLYSEMKIEKNWYLMSETCRLSVSLRQIVKKADDSCNELYKNFNTAYYNCLSAAICVRRPNEQIYNCVFDEQAWSYIVDCEKVLKLELRSAYNKRTHRHVTSIKMPSDVSLSMSTSGTSMSLSVIRHFVNTLSENPLQFDMLTDHNETISQQEIELQVNELNSMECSTTVTSLLCHAVSLPHTGWLDRVVSCLVGGAHCNVKYFLAQCICNSMEVLKIHKNILTPALLQLIVDTCKGTLNSLHVDVLETIIHWSAIPSEMSVSNQVFRHLVDSCLRCVERRNVYYRLLAILKEVVKWDVRCDFDMFKQFFDDKSKYNPKVTDLLTLLVKAKRVDNVQGLLLKLTVIIDSNLNIRMSKLSQLYGAALTASGGTNDFVSRFRKVLDKKRRTDVAEYMRMLYCAQTESDKVVDDIHYRTCLDLLTKLPTTEKLKCLAILTSHMNHLELSECKSLFETVRCDSELEVSCERQLIKMAVVGLKAQYENTKAPSKKPKLLMTPILSDYDSKDPYSNKIISLVSKGVMEGDILNDLVTILSEDLGVRFFESFILSIYLPALNQTHNETQDESVCLSMFLQLFLSGIMSQERFKTLKLRDEPLQLSQQSMTSKLMSMCKSYQGSLSKSVSVRQTNIISNKLDVDVEITLCCILDAILTFCKVKPSCAQELFLQLFRIITTLPGFDTQLIAKLINTILSKSVNELFPTVMEMSRIVIGDVMTVSGFENSINKLTLVTVGTEGELHTKLLYEELKLRGNDNEQFVLRLNSLYEAQDVCMGEDKLFCMKDLGQSFGKLSNWDDLSTEKKRLVVSELPPLWTDRQTALRYIGNFESGPYWLEKLIFSYKQGKENIIKWLRSVDRWPRRYFDVSSVTEAVLYMEKQNVANMFLCEIQKHECLAEWAARLMVRSSYLHSLAEDQTRNKVLSRSHELKWCERANEMSLPKFVLDCVKRNVPDINNNECLQWIRQKVLAQRTMGLETNDRSLLEKAHIYIAKNVLQFKSVTAPDVLIELHILSLKLYSDLSICTETSSKNLEDTIQEVYEQYQNPSSGFTLDNKQKLNEFYEIAITHYDDLVSDNTDENTRVSKMLDVLEKTEDLHLDRLDAILAIILNRVKKYGGLNDPNARRLLNTIERNENKFSEFSLQQMRLILKVLPTHVTNECSLMGNNGSISKYKKCFQLICDPEYLLVQYFDDMKKALERNDLEEWKKLYTKLKDNIFENPYIGSDYILLKKYKNMLEGIHNSLSKSHYEALPLMMQCQESLTPKIVNFVRLSQLCPTLVHDSSPDRDVTLFRLMGLSPGVTVVKFHEQVQVITTSIRRPVIIKALLSNGQTKRVLHKTGSVMNCEAVPQNVMKLASRLWKVKCADYNVTPLSEDSVLIGYLEDHATVCSLITGTCDLQSIRNTPQRKGDESLIFSLQDSLQIHNLLCDKVPAHTLRSAIETRSISLQDFIQKKQRFMESLACAAVLTWMLGVGDRHLENILYSIKDGGLCFIDWGEILQFGTRELPPARLTRNLLAVCDIAVLESRISKLWSDLRDSNKLMLGVIKMSFTWMGTGFDDKETNNLLGHVKSANPQWASVVDYCPFLLTLRRGPRPAVGDLVSVTLPYIESQLNGEKTTYHINKQSIENNTKEHKEKHSALLDTVFQDLVQKDRYTVDDQVSCFLRHCTDPRILSVTRRNWDPWV